MVVPTEYIEVACDESGNEGENLTRAGSRVFTHAGVTISVDDAEDLMSQLRVDLGTQATEIKSSVLLKPANRDVLEWLLTEPRLEGKADIHLTDKRYFVVGKIVDLIVEQVLHEAGQDIYSNGVAGDMARLLFVEGPAQLGTDWETAVDQFNTMLRTTVRKGAPATLSDFYASIGALRLRATGMLADLLRFVDAGRGEAADLVANKTKTAEDYLALDPTFAALATVVRTWHERTGQPVRVVHDETSLLTPQRIQALKSGLAEPGVPEAGLGPVPLLSVTLVDSKSDPRIQIADLLAGAARLVASEALAGRVSPLITQLRPFFDPNGLWGDPVSWRTLVSSAT
ncbi:DUF3800 domain-containing protein [Microbacterium sp. ZW CA_36]|uniref:DUF3800 domain-containing protein n=1 Tax=Microbacterium sp. ZW CA_36 TaxID=3378078 RepID=UPI003854F666